MARSLFTCGFKWLKETCAAVALLRAFVAAAALEEGKTSAELQSIVTGLNPDGTNDEGWIEKNKCFAKLAHRLLRIYDPVKTKGALYDWTV